MKLKHIIFLAIVLALLLGALFAKKICVRHEIEIAEYKNLQISIIPANVYGIEIKKAKKKEPLKLARKETGWTIASKWNIKGKTETIENLLTSLTGLQGELRSSSQKLLPDYGISKDQAFSIVILNKEGKPLEQLFIGAEKPSYGSCFVRKAASRDVYLVNKDIFASLGIYGEPREAKIDADRWMDLSVAALDVEKIEVVKLIYTTDRPITTVDIKKELDAEKNLKQWVTAGEKPVFDIDAKKIKDFLKKINDLRGTKAVDPRGKGYGFDKPFLKVSLQGTEKPVEILVGNTEEEDSGDRYIKTPDGYVYILPEYRLSDINIDISKFFIANPLRINKDKLQSVVIKSDKDRLTLRKHLIEENTDYIKILEDFSVKNMLTDKKYDASFKTPVKYSLTITREDASTSTIDVKKKKEGEEKIFIARLRGTPGVFTIEENLFEDIFEKLDDLTTAIKAPAEAPKETVIDSTVSP